MYQNKLNDLIKLTPLYTWSNPRLISKLIFKTIVRLINQCTSSFDFIVYILQHDRIYILCTEPTWLNIWILLWTKSLYE